MNADDNDKLWELLGKARQPSVSPFFARNVLRAIRQEEEVRRARSFPHRFLFKLTHALHRRAWQVAIAGTCAIAALLSLAPAPFLRHHHASQVQTGLDRQIVANPDYEVIKHLDELVADEESSLWLDDSSANTVN